MPGEAIVVLKSQKHASRYAMDRLPKKSAFALVWDLKSCNYSEERRLTTAGRSHYYDNLARTHLKTYIADNWDGAIRKGY